MARASRVAQTRVYIGKNFRIFMNQKDWKFIIIAAVISVLVCAIVHENMFDTYDGTQSGFFAIVSAAIWIGIFNSIQRICKEHQTITSECRSGLHLSAYVMSHVIFDALVCLAQAVVLFVVCLFFIDFPSEGLIFGSAYPEYIITLFLVIWGSDVMGIMISSIVSTPNVAMTTMPFVLIIQLVMSGVLFELKGWSVKVAYVTFSRWGMSALGSIGDLANGDKLPFKLQKEDAFKYLPMDWSSIERQSIYESTAGCLLRGWTLILLITIGFTAISYLSLKIRNRNS